MKWIEQNPKWSRLQRDLVFDRLWKGGAKIFTLVCEILPFKNEINDYLEKVSIRDEILLKLLVHLPTVSAVTVSHTWFMSCPHALSWMWNWVCHSSVVFKKAESKRLFYVESRTLQGWLSGGAAHTDVPGWSVVFSGIGTKEPQLKPKKILKKLSSKSRKVINC